MQAGVGGLAAAVIGYLWAALPHRPTFVVVEPESADCWFQSNLSGKPTLASGNADTVMGGLACREISPVTWPVVGEATDWFMTIEEDQVMPARRLLAHPLDGDPAIASGPRAAPAWPASTRACTDEAAFKALKLDRHSPRSVDQQRRQPRRRAGMNRLGAETSPYLLQHANNPVHWWPWGEEALAEAKRTNRPILLSVGYAACHWCHVMAHESFESPDVAAVMNELFVNIKVDREERPDVDAIYMQALQVLGEPGGWPLTMFCTPAGEPFWGGTYFPYPARYGRPSFVDVLRGVAQAFHDKPDEVETNRAGLLQALQRKATSKAVEFKGDGPPIPLELLDQIAQRIAEECDPVWGGIGQAPKFPSPYLFEMLWRGWLRDRDNTRLFESVTVTLDRMCQGGIYDHLGGGFARYATDNEWLIPHFEKMLYDNAQLVDLLTLVWQETKSPLYAARIAETCDWVLREMVAEGGGFAATYDADCEGVEGKFYVWDEAEIDAVLGDDAAFFKQVYDVTAAGQLGAPHHPAPQSRAGAAERGRRAAAGGLARQAEGGARQARVAGLGRQGAGRLERADDRGPGQRRRRVPARRLAGRRASAPGAS